jgi:hypothetical protein
MHNDWADEASGRKMRSPEAERRLRRNPGGLGHQEGGSGRKMTPQKPGCPSRKKDEGSGRQENGGQRKAGAREAQKASRKQSGRPDGKKTIRDETKAAGKDRNRFSSFGRLQDGSSEAVSAFGRGMLAGKAFTARAATR